MEHRIKIAFVCTGNTCRSPMAQFILRQKLKEKGFSSVAVSSFGLDVKESKMNENAIEALRILGVKRTKFTPKQLTKPELYDAIVTMTEQQKKSIVSKNSNVYSFAELSGLGDIPDPYGQSLQEYIAVAVLLDSSCNEIIKILGRLLNENSDGQ